MTKSQQLMVTTNKFCEFLFLYCFCFSTSYELAAIFMNANVLDGVALLMGDLCVVWSDWADLFWCQSIVYNG